MEGKKINTEIDWNALDEHWAEQYEKEFGHLVVSSGRFFITSIK